MLDTSRLWRDLANEMSAEYPDVQLDHQLVDSMTMKLIEQPAAYDVIVTENLFGDILSDLAASVSRRHRPRALRRRSATAAPASSSRSTAPRPTSRERAGRTPSR